MDGTAKTVYLISIRNSTRTSHVFIINWKYVMGDSVELNFGFPLMTLLTENPGIKSKVNNTAHQYCIAILARTKSTVYRFLAL